MNSLPRNNELASINSQPIPVLGHGWQQNAVLTFGCWKPIKGHGSEIAVALTNNTATYLFKNTWTQRRSLKKNATGRKLTNERSLRIIETH